MGDSYVSADTGAMPFGLDDSEYRSARTKAGAVAGLSLGLATWFGLVVGDRLDAEPRVAAFWWAVPLTAVLLGVVFRAQYGEVAACIFGMTHFVLSFPTAPRGDNDGLWLFWIPLTFVALFLYLALASIGSRVRALVSSDRRRKASA
jgi:uncharacterized membrane protein